MKANYTGLAQMGFMLVNSAKNLIYINVEAVQVLTYPGSSADLDYL